MAKIWNISHVVPIARRPASVCWAVDDRCVLEPAGRAAFASPVMSSMETDALNLGIAGVSSTELT